MNFESVTFYKPAKTLSISLTGKTCSLSCAHCGGHYLSHMTDINTFIKNIDSNKLQYTSLLISGGCNPLGLISLKEHADNLRILADKGFKLNFHTGIADEESVNIIEELSSRSKVGHEFSVSYDFILDNETIKNVYGLERSGNDYFEAYKRLSGRLRVFPHICIGLYGGKLKGEIEALEALARDGCSKVVLIIFIPTKNTGYEKCLPPALSDIETVFKRAKELFPDKTIQLGCMRPAGKLRSSIDLLALENGINHIVMPSKEVVERAKELGLKIEYKEECCVL